MASALASVTPEPSSDSAPRTKTPTGATPVATPRPWQTQRRPVAHHILGWIITDEMCYNFCRRECPEPTYHTNPEGQTEDDHLDMLRHILAQVICAEFQLPCASPSLVYRTDENSELAWAVVMTDNWGWPLALRLLPHPGLVDIVKEELGTQEEPRWLMRAT